MFDRLDALRKAGWDCLIESDTDDLWRVELTIGDECFCIDPDCDHGRYVYAHGPDLLACIEFAIERAEGIRWPIATE